MKLDVANAEFVIQQLLKKPEFTMPVDSVQRDAVIMGLLELVSTLSPRLRGVFIRATGLYGEPLPYTRIKVPALRPHRRVWIGVPRGGEYPDWNSASKFVNRKYVSNNQVRAMHIQACRLVSGRRMRYLRDAVELAKGGI